ncbi:MAG: thioredoxin family protein [Oscillospiraceae bacterium]|jgi:thioredoxin 1|nr:thioredoxin family protein [Oscillospiraceae bacterium]
MLELDKETFEQEVLQAKDTVLVDFFSHACEPCMALMPTMQAFSEKYGDKLKFTKLDIAKARRMAISQKILGIPVVAIYKDGGKLKELVKDDCTPENVEKMILEYINN